MDDSQLQLIFTVFLLNILLKFFCDDKCFSMKDRNFQLVATFALYGGLNHIIFLSRFLVVVVFDFLFCWYLICVYTLLSLVPPCN